MLREPLSRREVINAIERKGCDRVPLVFHKWWGEGLVEKYGERLTKMSERFPDDIFIAWHLEPGFETSPNSNRSYRLGYKDDYSNEERHSIGKAVVLLPDWSDLDKFLDDFPDPNEPGNFDSVVSSLPLAGDRYKLGCWWRLFHERLWAVRGMENLMLDYYDNMEGLKLIGRRILDFYKVIVDRYAELGFDGIFTSDDLGHQTGPMMSPAIFMELYLPLYEEFADHVHSKGMHLFLHSCGDNTKLMEYLISAGVDVFHPVQKGCMDFKQTAEAYGDRITFLAGMDVQHTLPEGSPQDVINEVRYMKEVFHTPRGGLLLAAGNGIMPDTPLENIEAMLTAMAEL
ncbi:MAG TPA: uroporphyrinogen decarboxylase family protein [Candidatus Atribacteria bacterium]|nr:uroporphyrinogen decarboxylase family protein [Candidatus Atribacteria bacterium]